MSSLLFCLIFIQVSVFLVAGCVLATTCYKVAKQFAEDNLDGPTDMDEPRGYVIGNSLLTRNEISFLLGR